MSTTTTFTEADRLHIFTLKELTERLAGKCAAETFLNQLAIPTRKNSTGALYVLGADILNAIQNPPAPDTVPDPTPASAAVHDLHPSATPARPAPPRAGRRRPKSPPKSHGRIHPTEEKA